MNVSFAIKLNTKYTTPALRKLFKSNKFLHFVVKGHEIKNPIG